MSSPDKHSPDGGLSRRDLLLTAGMAAAMAYAGPGAAAMPGHDHSKHKPQHPDMLKATNECLASGRNCIAHCLKSFQEGDLQLADCAAKVTEMEAVCGGFAYLVASNSQYTKAYAKVCEQVCKDCEEECMKHKEHVECKACGEACAALVEQIQAFLG